MIGKQQLDSFWTCASKTPVSKLDLHLWRSEGSQGDMAQDIHEGVKKLSLAPHEKKKKEVVWVSPDETLGHTIKILTGQKMYIPASPVVDHKEKCQRLISIDDLISFVLKQLPDPTLIRSREHELLSKIFATRLGDVLEQIPRSDPEFLNENNSVLDALERFGRCVHQLCLIRQDGTCMGICSQMDAFSWIQPYLEKGKALEEFGSQTLENLIIQQWIALQGRDGIKSVLDSDTVLSALYKLAKDHIHGIAVVNEAGRIVGNFSSTDFRALVCPENWSFLFGRVDEYLDQFSPDSLKPFCISKESTVRDIVNEFLDSHLYHAFVVDSDFIPFGYLSLSDLCRIVSEQGKWRFQEAKEGGEKAYPQEKLPEKPLEKSLEKESRPLEASKEETPVESDKEWVKKEGGWTLKEGDASKRNKEGADKEWVEKEGGWVKNFEHLEGGKTEGGLPTSSQESHSPQGQRELSDQEQRQRALFRKRL